MTTPERGIEEIVEEFNSTFPGCDQCQYGNGQGDWIEHWLTQTLQAERQRCEEMVKAERERVIDHIRQYRGRQVLAYGNDKLPFVIWEGKADEKEKITIYEQAFKDILQALTQPQ